MRDHYESQSTSRPAGLLPWLERLLVLAGVAALIWCAALVADAVIAQRTARSALQAAIPEDTPVPAPSLDGVALAPRGSGVSTGSAIALLSIPRIELSAAVLHGSDAKTLRRGPGHLENTALPGEPGNMVIAGHRDSFFRPLRNIRLGDDIYVDTPEERFHYQVASLDVVNPRDVSVLAPTNDATLTLITCYPFWVLGQAPDRFIVRATRVGAPLAPPLEARRLPLVGVDGPLPSATAAANESAPTVSGAAHDDERLVRHTVRRYLNMQGSRVVTQSDVTLPDSHSRRGPAFTCEVTVGNDRAMADCDPLTHSPEQEAHARTFMLERSNDTWAIRSIVWK